MLLEPSPDALPKIASLLLSAAPWRPGSKAALVRSEVKLPVGAQGLTVPEDRPVFQARCPAQSQRKPSRGF